MSEQRAEYHYEGREQARKKQSERQLIAQLAAKPEQFAELLTEDQARAIVDAILATYPNISQISQRI